MSEVVGGYIAVCARFVLFIMNWGDAWARKWICLPQPCVTCNVYVGAGLCRRSITTVSRSYYYCAIYYQSLGIFATSDDARSDLCLHGRIIFSIMWVGFLYKATQY